VDTYSGYDCFTNNGGVNVKEIKVEEINEMLKNMLTLGQYVELLQLMIKECEIFMDNNGGGCSSGLHN
jgi:hypothetical protein